MTRFPEAGGVADSTGISESENAGWVDILSYSAGCCGRSSRRTDDDDYVVDAYELTANDESEARFTLLDGRTFSIGNQDTSADEYESANITPGVLSWSEVEIGYDSGSGSVKLHVVPVAPHKHPI